VETVAGPDAKYFQATQVVDEARHTEVLDRYMREKLGGLYYPMPPNERELFDVLLGDSRWAVKTIGLQLVAETFAVALFRMLAETSKDPLLREICRFILQDESRHMGFGMLSLPAVVRELTDPERKALGLESGLVVVEVASRPGAGSAILPGDVIIGVKSNGLHSNGYSLARRAFFDIGRFGIEHKFDELELTLGEELLRPTPIYVREALEILANVRGVKALFNITGDGLMNLARAAAPVGFEIEHPIEPQPIFGLIQRLANVSDAEMFEVFNMGTGFCYVVAPEAVDATLAVLKKHGRDARPIGHTVADPEKKVRIASRTLVGQGKKFHIEYGR
jgi:hypothetical protein